MQQLQQRTDKKILDVLLIEDNPGDIRLTRETFEECRIPCRLSFVRDGIEALYYLNKNDKYVTASRPDLILLDLNLPKKDGREVLKEIKENPDLKRIPVLVLTTSQSEDDIMKSYDLHANAYLFKPLDIMEFLKVVRAVEDFWLSVVKLPPS